MNSSSTPSNPLLVQPTGSAKGVSIVQILARTFVPHSHSARMYYCIHHLLLGRDSQSARRRRKWPAEMEAAARVANAHSFIIKLPDGYDTQVPRAHARAHQIRSMSTSGHVLHSILELVLIRSDP
jgi:hypothetical protein